jgi:hypothetical protein
MKKNPKKFEGIVCEFGEGVGGGSPKQLVQAIMHTVVTQTQCQPPTYEV